MNENTDTIRYYVGYEVDLYGMSRVDVEDRTYEDRYEAEEAAAGLDTGLTWVELLAELVHKVDLSDYPDK